MVNTRRFSNSLSAHSGFLDGRRLIRLLTVFTRLAVYQIVALPDGGAPIGLTLGLGGGAGVALISRPFSLTTAAFIGFYP